MFNDTVISFEVYDLFSPILHNNKSPTLASELLTLEIILKIVSISGLIFSNGVE